MGFWLDTFPAGSVRLLHLRSEMEKGIGEVKPVLAHPASLFDISWHPGTSTSLTTFNINSWMIFEKDGSTTPSASPAGLFSFTADLSSGLLVSVSAGATDHASLLDFMTSAAQSYPHLDREALCRLAIQNSYESAAELAQSLWSAIGGMWHKMEAKKCLKETQTKQSFHYERDIAAEMNAAIGEAAKRLYRDLERSNSPDIREKLISMDGGQIKRQKLTSSRRTKEKQILQTTAENTLRSIVIRGSKLPLSSISAFNPKKKKSKKNDKDKNANEPPVEELDAGSGGFIRVAQLVSQSTPEAIYVTNAALDITVDVYQTRTGEPENVQELLVQDVQLSVCGLVRQVSKRVLHSTWFLWNPLLKEDILDKLQGYSSTFSKSVEAQHALISTGYQGNSKETKKGVDNFVSAVFRIFQSDGLVKQDVETLVGFITHTDLPDQALVTSILASMDLDQDGTVSWYEFDAWSKTSKGKSGLEALETIYFSVEQLDGRDWECRLFGVDLATGTASIYSSKALAVSKLSPSSLKKYLKSSFTFASREFIDPYTTPNTLRFGKSSQDYTFVLKLKPSHFKLVERICQVLSSQHGLAASSESFSNLQLHALNMVDVVFPALSSIPELA